MTLDPNNLWEEYNTLEYFCRALGHCDMRCDKCVCYSSIMEDRCIKIHIRNLLALDADIETNSYETLLDIISYLINSFHKSCNGFCEDCPYNIFNSCARQQVKREVSMWGGPFEKLCESPNK